MSQEKLILDQRRSHGISVVEEDAWKYLIIEKARQELARRFQVAGKVERIIN